MILIIALLAVLGVSLDHLLIGAGIAGIILGVAAQQSLGNIFAAVVMLFARPFVVGDTIRIRSGTLGVIDVKVLGTGLTYVTVMSDDGVLRVPNSIMLGAGIGQLRARRHPYSFTGSVGTAHTYERFDIACLALNHTRLRGAVEWLAERHG